MDSLRTEPVKRGDLVSVIKATGTIEPEDAVDVGAQVMGRIEDLGVDLEAESEERDADPQATRATREQRTTAENLRNEERQCARQSQDGDEPVHTAKEDRPHSAGNRPRIDYNSIVRVGTELAYIDATRYEAQYEQAKAVLERSIADLGQFEAKAEQAAARAAAIATTA